MSDPRSHFRFAVAVLAIFCWSDSGRANAQPQQPGLAKRVPWTTSRITGSPQPPSPYLAEQVFPHLTFNEPGEMVAIPGTNRLAVIEVKGNIYSFENRANVQLAERDLFADMPRQSTPFSSVYGLAFHPHFAENRYCYISYVTAPKVADGTRVSRFRVTDSDPPRIDPASEQIIITWYGGGHNGAHLQFGPEGYLYISTGDGGESFPPDGHNTGQDISDLLASILRIDVDRPEAGRVYRIPPDNPFVGTAGARGEIWAYGLRNPWKMAFDPADGSLWVGDVGWEMWEMIYRIERGGNYGWSIVEGSQSVHRERKNGPTPILPPTTEHDHTEARSITGGYVYRGSRLPELRGAYIYGDYVTGKIWALRYSNGQVTRREELVDTPLQIVTFGLDPSGELYFLDYAGTVHWLVPNPRRGANAQFPQKLSETGLFASVAEHRLAPGVIPYSINAEPWADGAMAERLVALPGTSQLGVYQKTNVQIGYIAGEWEFPSDGVLAKTVSIELEPGNPASRRRLETQVLHFDVDTWKAYNYLWNDEQTDATLAPDVSSDSKLRIRDPAAAGGMRQQTWHHASRTECLLCHTTRAGSIHGFRLPQLHRQHDYGSGQADQLGTLAHLGLFKQPLPQKLPKWSDPTDESADLQARARAYLHVNCAHCHRRGGGGSAAFDVQHDLPLEKARLLAARPTQGTFGMHGAEIVAPGDPYRSVLLYRMSKLGHGRMPQFGSQVVDTQGTRLIHDWIASLSPIAGDSSASSQRLRAERATALAQLLAAAPQQERTHDESWQLLLSSPSGALQLLGVLNTQPVAPPIRDHAIERGLASSDAVIRDLFERFTPEEQRTQRLGSSVKPADILALPGDASRGGRLFFNAAGVQCRNCHRVGEQGRAVGPDLTGIGKKHPPAKLLESILEPSKAIEPQFLTYLVETADGQVLSGLLLRRSEAEVVLCNSEGKEVSIPAAEIEQIAPQQKSLMPDLLVRELTAQQLADLLAYLSSLK